MDALFFAKTLSGSLSPITIRFQLSFLDSYRIGNSSYFATQNKELLQAEAGLGEIWASPQGWGLNGNLGS